MVSRDIAHSNTVLAERLHTETLVRVAVVVLSVEKYFYRIIIKLILFIKMTQNACDMSLYYYIM